MWNIFKIKKEAILNKENIMNDLPLVISSKIYPKEVLEIHHEFHTAADKLVLEARTIIAEAASKNVSKVSRLEALGFKQAAQVTELKPLQQKAELSKEQIESLNYYTLNYPNNKFITEEQVKIICHKYNLVCGDVGRFTGFIPDKNLKDIEKFKLKSEDHYKDKSESTYGKDIGKIIDDGGRSSREYPSLFKIIKGNINNLQICAPVKDMDLKGLELIEGYKLTKKHIPDPVVLQPVKNGYLILTAWGDEASDELVVNNKFN